MQKMPPITMGDIVSLGLHNYDNAKGLDVDVNGKNVQVEGDGFLAPGSTTGSQNQQSKDDTFRIASNAVASGIEDIKKAYELAKQYPKLPARKIVERLKDENGRFNFEGFIPNEDKKLASPLPRWKFKTVDQLLADPKMRSIVEEVVEGNIDALKAVGKDLNKVQRKALLGKGGVIDQFKANPIGTFEQILAYDN